MHPSRVPAGRRRRQTVRPRLGPNRYLRGDTRATQIHHSRSDGPPDRRAARERLFVDASVDAFFDAFGDDSVDVCADTRIARRDPPPRPAIRASMAVSTTRIPPTSPRRRRAPGGDRKGREHLRPAPIPRAAPSVMPVWKRADSAPEEKAGAGEMDKLPAPEDAPRARGQQRSRSTHTSRPRPTRRPSSPCRSPTS